MNDAKPIPPSEPVPFAICPTGLISWPIWPKAGGAANKLVTYQDVTGAIVGVDPSRRFLADRGPTPQSQGVERFHVGVDLYAVAGDKVVAIAAGRIVAFYPFYAASTGQMTYALLVQHDGVVVNYGEVTNDVLTRLSIGDDVASGEWLGVVSDTNMTHFETYISGTTQNYKWLQNGAPQPPALLNPTKLLLNLAANAV